MFPLKDTVPNRSFPSATWLLIALSGIVFYFETFSEKDAGGVIEASVQPSAISYQQKITIEDPLRQDRRESQCKVIF